MSQRVVRDDAFLRRAMRDHGASVLRLALAQTGSRADAEDVYQDVFVALALQRHRVRRRRPPARVAAARHGQPLSDLARSWWRRHAQSFDALGIEVAQGEKDEGARDPAELWSAVQRLPERYRAVVHLRYVEQLPVDAIAQACGISESAVRTRLSRATNKLRVYLGGMS